MTPDQQSIAAALHLGAKWKTKKRDNGTWWVLTFVDHKGPFEYGGKTAYTEDGQLWRDFEGVNGPVIIASDIPAYPTSLDAVAKLEATLANDQQSTYLNRLGQVVGSDRRPRGWQRRLGVCLANASQRLEACLRTLNLWTS